MSAPDRSEMLGRAGKTLSIRRQCGLAGVARCGVCRAKKPARGTGAALIRRIDGLFTAWPFPGSRRMAAVLRAERSRVNRKRVQRLIRKIGIAARGPNPRTAKPAQGYQIYPYLLRHVTIERANHGWAAGITYIPAGRGFLYLVAIIGWASRAVLAWRLSNTMDVSCCRAALEQAFAKSGNPEIFNTGQGSQFTSAACTGALAAQGAAIAIDGRGRWMDNVLIERLRRPLQHEDVDIKGYAGGLEARLGIAAWMEFSNGRRLHQALGYRPPMALWREHIARAGAADMMDNAFGLPACRQQQQQTQPLAA